MWLLWLALGICAALLLTAGLLMRVYLGAYRSYDVMGFADHLSGAMAPYAPVIRAAIEANRDLPAELWTIRSDDGLRLAGDFYRAEGTPRGTVLLVHGFRGGSRGDFSCAIPLYHRLGWNELLIDQRAQGRSEGARMGLGVLERRDVAAWARELSARLPGLPIVLDGISMGASSVMMACGLPLPAEVRGVIADCGFTSPEDIFRWLLERGHAPAALLLPLFRLAARPALGYGLRDAATTDALAHSTLPILLVHGEADRFVPCEMSRENFAAAAAPDKTLITVPGATHGMSFLVDEARCTAAVTALLARCAGGAPAGGEPARPDQP